MSTIEYRVGDFLGGNEHVFVHGCNAQGVMGSGAAAAVRKKKISESIPIIYP